MPNPFRCQSISPFTGIQCGLPLNHSKFGDPMALHSNGMGQRTWTTQDEMNGLKLDIEIEKLQKEK